MASPLFQGPVHQQSLRPSLPNAPRAQPHLGASTAPTITQATSPGTRAPAIARCLATLNRAHNCQRGPFPRGPAHKPCRAPVYPERGPKPHYGLRGLRAHLPGLPAHCLAPPSSLPDHQHAKHTPDHQHATHTPLQDLCTCCSNHHEHPSSVCLMACCSLTSFKSSLQCDLVGKAFPTVACLWA